MALASARGPTRDPVHPQGLATVLERDVRSPGTRRRREGRDACRQERLAQAVTRSRAFVQLHLALLRSRMAAHSGWVPRGPQGIGSSVILAMWASVEASFLSTPVLNRQNQISIVPGKRADLDLQASRLAEHEVTRRVIPPAVVADRLDVRTEVDAELRDAQRDVTPEAGLDEIQATEGARS